MVYKKGQAAIGVPSAGTTGTLRGQAAIELPSSGNARHLRGQAAMEYLMTYGWAVLVIVIVIAALFSFTSFFKVGDQCLFSQKFFSCSDPNPQVLTNGQIIFTLRNMGQKAVFIHSAACVVDTSEITEDDFVRFEKLIQAGSSETFKKAELKCTRGEAVLSDGDEFRGNLVVKYNYDNEPTGADGYAERQASAVLTSTVVSGTFSTGDGDGSGTGSTT